MSFRCCNYLLQRQNTGQRCATKSANNAAQSTLGVNGGVPDAAAFVRTQYMSRLLSQQSQTPTHTPRGAAFR